MKIVILDIFAFYSMFLGLEMKYYIKFFFAENKHGAEHLISFSSFPNKFEAPEIKFKN